MLRARNKVEIVSLSPRLQADGTTKWIMLKYSLQRRSCKNMLLDFCLEDCSASLYIQLKISINKQLF